MLQENGILLTTYDIVRNNLKSLQEPDEDSITWDYMFLDEGHLIKNPSTQRAKSLLEIPAAHRIVISGTPIQNNLRVILRAASLCSAFIPVCLNNTVYFSTIMCHFLTLE